MSDRAFQLFERKQKDRGIDLNRVIEKLKSLEIETPSWGYGDSGTRFKVFQQEGVPRDPFEKMEDAAEVHRVTGIAPRVAIHIPWDYVDDFAKLKEHAQSFSGIAIGAVNPNLFQEDEYKFGSLCNSDPAIRRKAIDHILDCIEIAKQVDSKEISLWLADGTNYPGQADIRKRKHWLYETLKEVYQQMNSLICDCSDRIQIFRASILSHRLARLGTAYSLALKLGDQAQVLVDLGHHPQGTNVEQIVAYLIDEKKLGGFHFNNRKYADDDLIVGSINPYELFLIFDQILNASEDKTVKSKRRPTVSRI